VLRPGDSGAAVLALQRRLTDLGYSLGATDGQYGTSTQHAVIAFQKAARLTLRDGVAGPVTLAALDRDSRLRPRSTSGRVVEVDLALQLLLVAVDGRVQWVMDTSTGSVPGTTPAGRFTVLRQVDGYDPGPLGVLYRPKYFVGGVAVHGYPTVPPYPASHGCVRVTNAAMDWLWSNQALPIGGPVWVY
jgi:lipoprotein-anchoring transpeptidase ErfK/SrfK